MGRDESGTLACLREHRRQRLELDFTPESEPLPDKLGCGAPEGEPWQRGSQET